MDDTQCYYTPQRVRWWLDRYPALQAASEGACGLGDLSADPEGLREVALYPAPRREGVDPKVDPRYYRSPSPRSRATGLASEALCVKCDLDRAMKRVLNPCEREVVVLRWCEEWTVREIAAKLRASVGLVAKLSQNSVNKIARNLGYTL